MLDIAYVNNVGVIAKNPKMTAINSAIEVDLTGQVCSDSIGTRMYSGLYNKRKNAITKTGIDFITKFIIIQDLVDKLTLFVEQLKVLMAKGNQLSLYQLPQNAMNPKLFQKSN